MERKGRRNSTDSTYWVEKPELKRQQFGKCLFCHRSNL